MTSTSKIPVPKGMRTDRKTPRIIASTLVLFWIVIYGVGTSVLARENMDGLTALEKQFADNPQALERYLTELKNSIEKGKPSHD